jgi:cell division protein FtsB
VIGVVILVFLMMDFNNRMADLQRLSAERDHLTTRVVQLTQTIQVLNTKIAYATSDVAVDEWAREEGKLIKTGDVPIVPISPVNATPQPIAVVKPTQRVVSNWDIWYALFMGKY